jgi:hypothetical protein
MFSIMLMLDGMLDENNVQALVCNYFFYYANASSLMVFILGGDGNVNVYQTNLDYPQGELLWPLNWG